jgi:hypothetical protein
MGQPHEEYVIFNTSMNHPANYSIVWVSAVTIGMPKVENVRGNTVREPRAFPTEVCDRRSS